MSILSPLYQFFRLSSSFELLYTWRTAGLPWIHRDGDGEQDQLPSSRTSHAPDKQVTNLLITLHGMAGPHAEAADGAENCRERVECFDIIAHYRILSPKTGMLSVHVLG